MSALDQQVSDLLGRLSILTEAPAGNLEAQIARSAPESSAPGAACPRDLTVDGHRDRSLYDWYRAEFEKRANEPDRLLSLYLAGEREYLRRVDPRIHDRTVERGSIVALSENGATVEEIAAIQVINEFEGVHALDVAIVEGKTEAWVRKVRRLHDCNPDDGRRRPPFLDWDDAERRRQIRLLQDQAKHRGEVLGAKALGQHFGVAKNTVRPYLEPVAVAA